MLSNAGKILQYDKIRSFIWSPQLHVTFYNRSPENLLVYWINYSGQAVNPSHLNKNSGISFITYESHPFMATNLAGEVRGVYIMFGRNAAVTFK